MVSGELLGHYRIDAKLGEGGMGAVYRATDTDLGRTVALKTILAAADATSESVERFRREARAAARLQHPAIVALYEFHIEGATRYLVMEYVEGQPLKTLIGGHPMSLDQFYGVALQVADALAEAHEKGVIHRDIKADNIIVTAHGLVKILDFGLAKLKEPQKSEAEQRTVFQTRLGMMMGTITHMPPEQALGIEVDDRADVFSLGVMLYEMATGRLPFKADTAPATLELILNHEPAPARTLNPKLPEALTSLIHECLQKDRALRPAARDVVERLKRISSGPAAAATPAFKTQIMSPPVSRPPLPRAAERELRPAAQAARPAMPSGAAPPARRAAVSRERTAPVGRALPHSFFRVVKIGSLALPLVFFLYFFAAGAIEPAALEQSTWFRLLGRVVLPPLRLGERLLTFRPVIGGWNVLLIGLGLLGFLLRAFLLMPLENWERRAQQRRLTARGGD